MHTSSVDLRVRIKSSTMATKYRVLYATLNGGNSLGHCMLHITTPHFINGAKIQAMGCIDWQSIMENGYHYHL